MKTKLGWELLSTPAGFLSTHIACSETFEINLATVAAMYGMGEDMYVEPYRDFLRYHNTWLCREADRDLEFLLTLGQDADSAQPDAC